MKSFVLLKKHRRLRKSKKPWSLCKFLMYFMSSPPSGLPHVAEGSHVPSVVWISVAVLLFLSHTLDGIDGKQARRTGTSTPLGELFDHG